MHIFHKMSQISQLTKVLIPDFLGQYFIDMFSLYCAPAFEAAVGNAVHRKWQVNEVMDKLLTSKIVHLQGRFSEWWHPWWTLRPLLTNTSSAPLTVCVLNGNVKIAWSSFVKLYEGLYVRSYTLPTGRRRNGWLREVMRKELIKGLGRRWESNWAKDRSKPWKFLVVISFRTRNCHGSHTEANVINIS